MFDNSYSFQEEDYRRSSPNLAIIDYDDENENENAGQQQVDEHPVSINNECVSLKQQPMSTPTSWQDNSHSDWRSSFSEKKYNENKEKKYNRHRQSEAGADFEPPISENLGEQLKHSARKRMEFFYFVAYGVLLTLVAGYMNAISILLAGIPAAHMSGTSSKAGIQLGQDKFIAFSDTVLMIPSFIFGAFMASILVQSKPYHMSHHYNRVFLLGTCVLLAGFIIETTIDTSSTRFGTAYLTAFVCGLQNAASSMYSNNLLRTTHVTGTATDIGILLGHFVIGKESEFFRLYIFIPLIMAYIAGGALGGAMYDIYGSYALLGNIIGFGGTGLLYYFYLHYLRMGHHPRTRAATYATKIDEGGKPVIAYIESQKRSLLDLSNKSHISQNHGNHQAVEAAALTPLDTHQHKPFSGDVELGSIITATTNNDGEKDVRVHSIHQNQQQQQQQQLPVQQGQHGTGATDYATATTATDVDERNSSNSSSSSIVNPMMFVKEDS